MLLSALRILGLQLVLGVVLFLGLAGIQSLIHGPVYAGTFLKITFVDMNGPWVWVTGVGLMHFIMVNGRQLALNLSNVLTPSTTVISSMRVLDLGVTHRAALKFTLPITILGLFLALKFEVPHTGSSYWLITFSIAFVYYVAAYLLSAFYHAISAFGLLYSSIDDVAYSKDYSPWLIESIDNYLSITTAIGVLAIYAGFRGTLTAGFSFSADFWRPFLTVPLILFLPATLFYNFYPRYVLKRVLQHSVFRAMRRLSEADEGDARSLLLEMKEATLASGHILPFFGLKAVPSYLVAIAFVLSLVHSNDPSVHTFFDYLIGGTPPNPALQAPLGP